MNDSVCSTRTTPSLEVAQAAERVGDRAEALRVDARGHRVDREVAAEQVLPQRRALHRGQRARRRVVLGPRARDVDVQRPREHDHRGAETPVHLHSRAEPLRRRLGERHPVALDDDVHVEVGPAEQHVAHEAAHHVRAHPEVLGELADRPQRAEGLSGQQRFEVREEPLGRLAALLGHAAVEVRVAVLRPQHVLAGDDADEPPSSHHRHAADPALREQPLELRRARRRGPRRSGRGS